MSVGATVKAKAAPEEHAFPAKIADVRRSRIKERGGDLVGRYLDL